MKKIDVNNDLVPLNVFENDSKLVVDPVYTFKAHQSVESPLTNQFPALYHEEAKIMWGNKDLVAVTVLASEMCHHLHGWRLRVADCLRTVEAQEGMEGYGYHPSLVSLPGTGAHPRAMAIDIIPEFQDDNGEWQEVDMGVPFDHFSDDPETDNPAARDYVTFGSIEASAKVYENRRKLEFAMYKSAEFLGQPMAPLPDEYWDFRFPNDVSDEYAPLRDNDLLPIQRQINPDVLAVHECLKTGEYPQSIQKSISEVQLRLKSYKFERGYHNWPTFSFNS